MRDGCAGGVSTIAFFLLLSLLCSRVTRHFLLHVAQLFYFSAAGVRVKVMLWRCRSSGLNEKYLVRRPTACLNRKPALPSFLCPLSPVRVALFSAPVILRETMVNRTFVRYAPKPIYSPNFTNNIWSYLLWSPVIVPPSAAHQVQRP